MAIANRAAVNLNISFQILVFIFGIAGSYGSSIFDFFAKPPDGFPQWLPHLQSAPPAVPKGAPFSASLLRLVLRRSDDGHSDRWEVGSHCGFDLHFRDY